MKTETLTMLLRDIPQNKFLRKLILVVLRSHMVSNAGNTSAQDFEMDKMKYVDNIGHQNDAYM